MISYIEKIDGEKRMGNKTRYQWCSKDHFQYLKGVAILCVLVSHIGNYSGKTWFTPLGGLGVALFLFCSGYGLMASYCYKGLDHFWRKKFVTVYIPYFMVEVVVSVLARRTLVDTLLTLTFLQIKNALMWYMQYLVCCYFLFWVVCRFVPDRRIRYIIWGSAALLSFIFLNNLRGEQAIAFLGGLIYSDYERSYDLNRLEENGSGGGQIGKEDVLTWLFDSSDSSACIGS